MRETGVIWNGCFMMSQTELAAIVKKSRKAKWLSQRELAEKMGVTQVYISQLENGKIKDGNALSLLARLVGIDPQTGEEIPDTEFVPIDCADCPNLNALIEKILAEGRRRGIPLYKFREMIGWRNERKITYSKVYDALNILGLKLMIVEDQNGLSKSD